MPYYIPQQKWSIDQYQINVDRWINIDLTLIDQLFLAEPENQLPLDIYNRYCYFIVDNALKQGCVPRPARLHKHYFDFERGSLYLSHSLGFKERKWEF